MTENEKHLEDAGERVKAFEAEREPERLREAYMALENVNLADEPDRDVRDEVRAETLASWLRLVDLVDRRLDPAFDPKDAPMLPYAPLTDDPAVRAQAEKEAAADRAKMENYRIQIQLRRVNDGLTPRVEAFIRGAYTPSPSDQAELRAAIAEELSDPARKAALSKLLSPPQR